MFPAAACFHLHRRITDDDSAFASWTQLMSLLPGTTGVWLRRAFFVAAARHCGSNVCVSFGTVFSSRNVSLGDHTYIGHFCSLGDVAIESDVLIASHVSIMNGLHQHGTERFDIPVREQPGRYEPITIGQDSWIGEHATVAATVGKHCVIGAGALVLKPIPDFAIAVGVPARIVGDRRESGAISLQSPMESAVGETANRDVATADAHTSPAVSQGV